MIEALIWTEQSEANAKLVGSTSVPHRRPFALSARGEGNAIDRVVADMADVPGLAGGETNAISRKLAIGEFADLAVSRQFTIEHLKGLIELEFAISQSSAAFHNRNGRTVYHAPAKFLTSALNGDAWMVLRDREKRAMKPPLSQFEIPTARIWVSIS